MHRVAQRHVRYSPPRERCATEWLAPLSAISAPEQTSVSVGLSVELRVDVEVSVFRYKDRRDAGSNEDTGLTGRPVRPSVDSRQHAPGLFRVALSVCDCRISHTYICRRCVHGDGHAVLPDS